MDTNKPLSFPRLFLHFFDIHFLEERGAKDVHELIAWECRMATRLAIASSDEVIVPAASYVESVLCKKILDELSDLFPLGVLAITGNAQHILEFREAKLATYRSGSLQAKAYTRLRPGVVLPPFWARSRSATVDIIKDWRGHLEAGSVVPQLFAGLEIVVPSGFEESWFQVPEKLEGKAFVVDYLQDTLGAPSEHPIVRNRLHGIVNQSYFSSFIQDFNAGIVTDLVYLKSGYEIASCGPPLPYRKLLNQLRRQDLLPFVDQCSPLELLQLRNDPRWVAALELACSSPSQVEASKEYHEAKRKDKVGALKTFIVHGHDKALMFELKDYLQNTLGFPEPIILFQQPSSGRTLIEKFEESAGEIDAAVVLLTPDDLGAKSGDELKSRARQNVMFELGYFVGKLGRRSGRILLLHKGELEIPSDLAGVVYIDVSGGIKSAGEEIRREFSVIR